MPCTPLPFVHLHLHLLLMLCQSVHSALITSRCRGCQTQYMKGLPLTCQHPYLPSFDPQACMQNLPLHWSMHSTGWKLTPCFALVVLPPETIVVCNAALQSDIMQMMLSHCAWMSVANGRYEGNVHSACEGSVCNAKRTSPEQLAQLRCLLAAYYASQVWLRDTTSEPRLRCLQARH